MNLTKKIIIGVCIYLVFLLALLPASVVIKLAPLPNNINFSGISGSIWSGSIESVTIQNRQLEQVQWQLSPWALLLGQAKLDLVIGNRGSAVNGKGLVIFSMSGIDAEGLRFEAPTSFLLGNNRLPFRTKVGGDISLFIDRLEQGTPWCEQLNGKLFINSAGVKNQFGNYPLGDIELDLSCVDGNVKVKSDETMNQLGFSGTLVLQAEKVVQLSAKIKETASQPEDLKKALAFLGKKDSQGYYPISYQGRVPGL
ncbi:type II secretion system protein N [Shewanella sp.]|uniref:type II secretion system protein N n=1 Tax=Shewanella sp. TaxID=50422 RepID=UPI000C108039|nr:type II secretion system protein N [Shewanella sp.]MCJ8302022.1 type II secretion system protein N [Shewanella sp.]PHQ74432.1 MAG: type II secretion system protein N [Shewanella sp.]